jgi:hypothetical protein
MDGKIRGGAAWFPVVLPAVLGREYAGVVDSVPESLGVTFSSGRTGPAGVDGVGVEPLAADGLDESSTSRGSTRSTAGRDHRRRCQDLHLYLR